MHLLWMFRLYWKPLLGKRNLWKLWQMSVKVRMLPQLLFYHRLIRTKASLLNKNPKTHQIKNRHPKNQKTSWMPVSQLLSRRLWMPKRSWQSRTLQNGCRAVWRVSLRSSSHRKNRRITSSFRQRPSGLPKRKPEPLMWQLTSAFLRT